MTLLRDRSTGGARPKPGTGRGTAPGEGRPSVTRLLYSPTVAPYVFVLPFALVIAVFWVTRPSAMRVWVPLVSL